MKRALSIYLLLISFIDVFGQSGLFDKNVDWIPFSTSIKAISCSSNEWIISGWKRHCVYGMFLRVDSLGNAIDSLPDYPQLAYVSDLDTASGVVYFVGAQPPILVKRKTNNDQDYFNPDGFRIAIGKYDLHSKQFEIVEHIDSLDLFVYDSAYYNHPSHYFSALEGYPYRMSGYYYQCASMSPNKLFVSKGNYLAQVDPTNHFSVNWVKHFKGYINDLLYCNNYLYLATDSGLVQADVTGNQMRSMPTQGNATNGFKTIGGKIFFTDEQKVFETDSLLNIVANYNLSDSMVSWVGLSGNDTHLCLAGKRRNDSVNVLTVLDSNLITATFLPLLHQCNPPEWIAANDSGVLVGGKTVQLGANKSNVATYSTYTYNGLAEITNAEATVQSAEIDSNSLHYQLYWLNYPYQSFETANFNLTTTLINTGQDTIHSIALQSNCFFAQIAHGPDGLPVGEGCSDNPGFIFKNNLNVPPNDTFVVSIMNFETLTNHVFNLPIFIFSINDHPVGNSCDTSYFLTKQYDFRTGIDIVTSPEYKIFPNPSEGIIIIESSSKDKGIFTLSNLTGNVLLEMDLVETKQQINISAMAAGMYIATVRTEGKVPATCKLIKL